MYCPTHDAGLASTQDDMRARVRVDDGAQLPNLESIRRILHRVSKSVHEVEGATHLKALLHHPPSKPAKVTALARRRAVRLGAGNGRKLGSTLLGVQSLELGNVRLDLRARLVGRAGDFVLLVSEVLGRVELRGGVGDMEPAFCSCCSVANLHRANSTMRAFHACTLIYTPTHWRAVGDLPASTS